MKCASNTKIVDYCLFVPNDWIIARYGGDEFLAAGRCENAERLSILEDTIAKCLANEVADKQVSFELTVSTGGVIIEEGALVKDSVIMSGTVIKAGAKVTYSIIDGNSIISENATVGEDKATAKGIAVVGSGLCVEPNTVIDSEAMINSADFDGVTSIEK